MLEEAIEIGGKDLAFPVCEVILCSHPGIRINLNHVQSQFAYVPILDLAEMRVFRIVFALSVLEQLTEGEYGCFKKQFSNDAAYAENIHGPVDVAFTLGLLSGSEESFGRQVTSPAT